MIRRDILAAIPAIGCLACLASSTAVAATVAGTSAQEPRRSGPRGPVIDVHTHCLHLPLVTDKLRQVFTAFPGAYDALTQPQIHIERMERLGIDRHVITQSSGFQGISWGDARQDLEIHRRINDHLAHDWVGRYPDRFYGAFGAPTQDLKLALPEIERMAGTPGMKVLQVSSHTPDGVYYGDPSLDPLLEALEHFGIPMFIHPHLQNRSVPLNDFDLHNSVGQGVEEAKVIGNIIFQGVFEKFPRLKIVVAHGGGFLPHYHGRMDRNAANFPKIARNLTKRPSEYLKNFYFDTCVYGSSILKALVDVVGADRVVLGGDYPVGVPQPIGEINGAGLEEHQVDTILSGAARVLEA